MTYEQVISYIEDRNKLGSVPGLDNINHLLKRLGNPEKKLPAIHIAGTNGKGSIMSFVEQGLMEAGYMAGRYISPAIFNYRERWQIGHEFISQEDTVKILSKVIAEVEEMERLGEGQPTSFEIETAAAFVYFLEKGCDLMLIECGMGGRLDATNVLGQDTVNVLASISRDHMQFLGNTIEEITKEKLGIIKDNGYLFTYPNVGVAKEVTEEFCHEHHVKLIPADSEALLVKETDFTGSLFAYKGKDYRIQMGGDFQILNAITAIEVMEGLKEASASWKTEISIPEDIIQSALSHTHWPGRFMVLNKEPLLIVDGAHNEDAWIHLQKSLTQYFPEMRFHFVLGVLKDKEVSRMLDLLLPLAKSIFTIASDNPRALAAENLANEIRSREENLKEDSTTFQYTVPSVSSRDSVGAAVESAIADAGQDHLPVICCGSLSFIGDVIRDFERISY